MWTVFIEFQVKVKMQLTCFLATRARRQTTPLTMPNEAMFVQARSGAHTCPSYQPE